MLSENILKNKNFLIYGLGTTGQSVNKFLKKYNKNNIFIWDDNPTLRKKFKINESSKKLNEKINRADFIVLSPGISIRKSIHKQILLRNQNKIITDIDIFFMTKNFLKSIIVTGTNGKSTTCSIIDKVLKSSGKHTVTVGNIGKPILDYKFNKKTIAVIEMSSFQLEYSKYLKPNHAVLLNISKDHLDWHGTMEKYTNSKLKVFSYQNKNDFGYVFESRKIIDKIKKNNFKGKLYVLKKKHIKFLKNKVKNNYLKSENNLENLSFIYTLIKKFKISDRIFFSSLKNFKGLPHRQELFFKRKKVYFINDSKATGFEAAKSCLKKYRNILWILGGLKKDGDKFFLNPVKKNIIKAFIIGKKRNFFKRQLKGKLNFKETVSLKDSLKPIFQEINSLNKKKMNETIFVILSPATASYDQFKNFEERGNQFKNLIKKYAKKYI